MTQRQSRTKITFTAAERKELWERWRLGESVSDIARALQRKPGTMIATALNPPTRVHGNRHCVLKIVSSRPMDNCVAWWPTNCAASGHLNRYQDGSESSMAMNAR